MEPFNYNPDQKGFARVDNAPMKQVAIRAFLDEKGQADMKGLVE